MLDQYSEIGDILAKYPDLTLEEDTLLKDWINQSDNNRKIFEELSSPSYLVNKLQRFEQIQSGKGGRWLRVQDAINVALQEGVKTVHKKVFWLRKWQTYVAAASIVLVALIGVKWFGKKNAPVKEKTPVVVQANDVAPGQFKAKLILADGSTVILDTTTNGQLATQGNIAVINKHGKLVYQKESQISGGKSKEILYNTLQTTKGQMYATVLSDGSRVWLNSESSIRYPVTFTEKERKVSITGEAYFEVAESVLRDSDGNAVKQPFKVSVASMEIEVLGTHFNINSYTDEDAVKTTLLEGKVRVRSAATNAQTILTPGDQAILRRGQDEKIVVNKDVDADADVAWRFGYFNFNNANLKTMMRQLERWYDVEVVYQGEVPNVEFLGKIPRELSLSQVLKGLQGQDIHFKMAGKKIIVTP